jgi:hypothetical protein
LAAIAACERSITHGYGVLLKERRNTSSDTKWTVAKNQWTKLRSQPLRLAISSYRSESSQNVVELSMAERDPAAGEVVW